MKIFNININLKDIIIYQNPKINYPNIEQKKISGMRDILI